MCLLESLAGLLISNLLIAGSLCWVLTRKSGVEFTLEFAICIRASTHFENQSTVLHQSVQVGLDTDLAIVLDKDIANQQATLARLAKLLEAARVPHQPESTYELEEPTQAIVPTGKERTSASLKSAPRIIEFALSVVDVRGPVLSSSLFL